MKKILFAMLAVVALALVGCEKKGMDIMSLDASKLDNETYKCWKFTIENAGLLNGTMYAWDTEHNVVLILQEAYKASGNKAIVNYQETPADDKEGCEKRD